MQSPGRLPAVTACGMHAEVRTFADCARYVLTTLMDLQSTPPRGTAMPFHPLFATERPDVSQQSGQLALLNTLKRTLTAWTPTMKKFLHEDEDQFDLLLTLEEYCGCKAMFSGGAGSGDLYVPIFSNVLYLLYDLEIIAEDVFLDWERQKEEDDEEDQVRNFVHQQPLRKHATAASPSCMADSPSCIAASPSASAPCVACAGRAYACAAVVVWGGCAGSRLSASHTCALYVHQHRRGQS
jgi:hypothetical protein